MYKPKYRYMFCISRRRSLWPSLSLISYLNSVDVVPHAAIKHNGENRIVLDSKALVNKVTQIPSDYDILLTEGVGLGMNDEGYERWRIQETAKRGKISLSLNMATSIMNTTINPYCKDAERLGVYGICMNDDRSIKHYTTFLPNLHFFNTGNPDWDYFKSRECEDEVNLWRGRLGNKILVIGYAVPKPEFSSWFKMITEVAVRQGFAVVLRKHPDTPLIEEFSKYYIENIHRLTLAKMATHYISDNFGSTSVAENFFAGTKVGTSPLIVHYKFWGDHIWLKERDAWETAVLNSTGSAKVLEMIPLIDNKESLDKFLLDDTPIFSLEENQKFFGGPITLNYSEHFFKCIEEKLSTKKGM